jgi:2-keto-4-pentenoate hydratase/2-oxohepta-3-ene-1,7-dioic acid hydratase in catechol pathway
MRVFSYRKGGQRGVGVAVGNESFTPVAAIDPALPPTLRAILETPHALERLRDGVHGRSATEGYDSIAFDPVIPEPNACWALALNFKAHLEETGLKTSTEHPHVFLRTAASLVGHRQSLICPPSELTREFDYEGELAVVIGKGGRHIPVERALEHVAGYASSNEGSVREFQRHNRQFGLGKNFERSGSIGPWLMTPDEFGVVGEKSVITRLNGIVRQRSLLSDMLFSVEQVIHYLSQGYALRPGDMIMMGTPGAVRPAPDDAIGNDMSKNFSRYRIPGVVHMRPGDKVEVEITGYGVLENTVEADAPYGYRPSC